MSQQSTLTKALKRRWMTSGDIQRLLGSTSPHRRITDVKKAGVTVKKRDSSTPGFRYQYRAA